MKLKVNDADVKEYARRTLDWMRKIKAVRDEEKMTLSTVTVKEWAEEFQLPVDINGNLAWETVELWQHVKLQLILEGEAIAVNQQGHYLGRNGEQASNIIRNITRAIALLRRSVTQWDGVRESGERHFLAVRKEMRGKINPQKAIGLIEASRGVSTLPQYQISMEDNLLLLVDKVEKQEEDKL